MSKKNYDHNHKIRVSFCISAHNILNFLNSADKISWLESSFELPTSDLFSIKKGPNCAWFRLEFKTQQGGGECFIVLVKDEQRGERYLQQLQGK